MTLASLSRRALLLALPLALAACDSGGPDEAVDPGVPMATVTLDLAAITAVRDCDSGDNPGDFHFQIGVSDARNQGLGSPVEVPSGTYGVDGSAENTVHLDDGEAFPLNERLSFSLAEETGSAFTVAFSVTEWDTSTSADPGVDDVQRLRTYDFRDGRFQNIAGPQSVTVYGSNSSVCQVRLDYTISVS